MTAAAVTRRLASNEVRALLPLWMGGVLAASAAALTNRIGPGALPLVALTSGIHELSVVACVAALIALGAQSVGHEYTNRTLGLTLMLPVRRRRLLLIKLVVLAAMVLPLATGIWLLQLFAEMTALPWLAAGAALWSAPLWTMLCRGPLAGAVFSASVPGTVLVAMTLLIRLVDPAADADRLGRQVWSWLMVPLLAGGAVLGWQQFMRLESIEGPPRDFELGWRPGVRRDSRPGRPLWRLAKKELHLQRMALVLTILFVVMSVVWALFQTRLPGDASSPAVMGIASAIYWLGLPVLIGALATAEERHLGTLAWQRQLPAPAWQQWAVKATMTVGLSLVLAIGVPVLLAQVLWSIERPNVELAIVLTLVTTAASMYISSLCATGVRAALASLGAIPIALWLVTMTAVTLDRARPEPAFWSGREGGWLAFTLFVVVLLIGFASANHRPEPPAASRIRRQTLCLGGVIVVGLLVLEAARL